VRSSAARLAGAAGRLRPAFTAGGSVTAGNSSSLNGGAAAVLVTSRRFADEHGLPVLATITVTATAGVPPRIMGIGPVPATALERTGLALGDVDLLNVNGGAIACGHPLGCAGARLVTTLVHELERRPDATERPARRSECCYATAPQGVSSAADRVCRARASAAMRCSSAGSSRSVPPSMRRMTPACASWRISRDTTSRTEPMASARC
jgi:acetyl-CoA acetyltransferase